MQTTRAARRQAADAAIYKFPRKRPVIVDPALRSVNDARRASMTTTRAGVTIGLRHIPERPQLGTEGERIQAALLAPPPPSTTTGRILAAVWRWL